MQLKKSVKRSSASKLAPLEVEINPTPIGSIFVLVVFSLIVIVAWHLLSRSWRDLHGNTDLHLAAQRGDEPALRQLITMGADLKARNQLGQTLLHLAASRASRICGESLGTSCLNLIDFLVEQGADITAQDWQGNTFLHLLFSESPTLTPTQLHQVAERFGRLFNIPNEVKITPFHWALSGLKFEIDTVVLLEKKKVDFEAVDYTQNTVLAYAVMGHQSGPVLSKLIEFGADYKKLADGGWSLLHWAAFVGNVDALAFFIRKGGLDINEADQSGKTSLHSVGTSSSQARPLAIVSLLLQNGADERIRDNSGRTAYDVMKKKPSFPDKEEVLKLLSYPQLDP